MVAGKRAADGERAVAEDKAARKAARKAAKKAERHAATAAAEAAAEAAAAVVPLLHATNPTPETPTLALKPLPYNPKLSQTLNYPDPKRTPIPRPNPNQVSLRDAQEWEAMPRAEP